MTDINDLIRHPASAALVDAFHAVYDIKDQAEPGGDVFVKCHYVCSHLHDLMDLVGVEAPDRRDRKR